jgi:hypothetical protein
LATAGFDIAAAVILYFQTATLSKKTRAWREAVIFPWYLEQLPNRALHTLEPGEIVTSATFPLAQPVTVQLSLSDGLAGVLKDAALGTIVQSVRIEGVTAGPTPVAVYDLTLGNVIISSAHDSSGPNDSLTFTYGQVALTTKVQNPDGSLNAGQTVNFTPVGSGKDGEVQTHDVYGDANISVRGSDKVEVTRNVDSVTGQATGDFSVTVTHKDGSKDIFKIHKGYHVNINALDAQVTWNKGGRVLNVPTLPGAQGNPPTTDQGVPEEFKDAFTLNGTDGQATDSSHPEDTQPDKREGASATYNTSKDVEIHTNFDDGIHEHHITAPGQVTIHKSNYSDSVNVTKNGNQFVITVTGQDGKQET